MAKLAVLRDLDAAVDGAAALLVLRNELDDAQEPAQRHLRPPRHPAEQRVLGHVEQRRQRLRAALGGGRLVERTRVDGIGHSILLSQGAPSPNACQCMHERGNPTSHASTEP
jgi:hypothetical protein